MGGQTPPRTWAPPFIKISHADSWRVPQASARGREFCNFAVIYDNLFEPVMCFLLQKKVRKDTQPENVITTSDDNAGIETTDRN